MRTVLVFLGAALIAAPAGGEGFWSGDKLLELCRAPDNGCQGYVAGVSDTIEATVALGFAKKTVCLPLGTTLGQLADISVAYLRQHPGTRREPAISQVVYALEEAFPCEATKTDNAKSDRLK